jgi:hypothetical protein
MMVFSSSRQNFKTNIKINGANFLELRSLLITEEKSNKD